jgi:[FeFe] hydrogenase H-cluster maturation GTPase HydF
MSSLNEAPFANRVHIGFFGLRNAGKSTLVNQFCSQNVAIVSDIPGTTTDPVSKTMEILPLGPCVITDTAGLDDEGELGELRVNKTLSILSKTDVAVWVGPGFENWKDRFSIPVIQFKRGDSIEELKSKIAALEIEKEPSLLEGLVSAGDKVVLVCPIDSSAPKGRLILPQVQTIRECLDRRATAVVCQVPEVLHNLEDCKLAITDAQAYPLVREVIKGKGIKLISFSELFARQKGDLDEYKKALAAVKNLKDGDKILIAEGCTHHRQCNDIGKVKIPKALERLSKAKLEYEFSSGNSFDLTDEIKLIVHCGGCMLTRREVQDRIKKARQKSIPILNYGILLSQTDAI